MGFVCTKPLYVRKHSSVSGQFEFKASGFNKVGATTLLIPRENVSKKLRSSFEYFIEEFLLTFNSRQIYEGGFFIVVGKKVSK